MKNLKQNLILRSITGFPVGIAFGYLITVFISLFFADGAYHPCVPELAERLGSEIAAVLLQTFLCGALGTVFAASSLIWEAEKWSLVKQTAIYFCIVSAAMLPVAYFNFWMQHTLVGFLSYFGIFLAIFVLVWLIQFAVGKRNVKKLNQNLDAVKQEKTK